MVRPSFASTVAGLAVLGACVLGISGCSNLQWSRAGAGPDSASLDESECMRLSRLQANSMAMTTPVSPPPAVLAMPGGSTVVPGGPMPMFAPDPATAQQFAMD